MIRRLALTLLALLLTASSAAAASFAWDQATVTTAAQANSFTYRVYVQPAGSTGPGSPTVLTAVSCTLSAGSTIASCSAPVPAGVSVSMATGTKYFLTVQDTASNTPESAMSLPFTLPAAVPTNVRITP